MPTRISKYMSPEKSYFVSRSFSIVGSLILSIAYSRSLGPENRGILSAVFLCGLLVSQIMCGGINLSFRSRKNGIIPEENIKLFVKFSIAFTFAITLICGLILVLYSYLKSHIAPNYFAASILYFVFSVFLEQLMQLLLALKSFKLAWKIEILTIGSQLVLYLVLGYLTIFTTGVRVLIAISFSYLISIFIVLKVSISLKYKSLSHENGNTTAWNLISGSFHNSIYTAITSIIDRVDRILVLLIFSSATFGKYSLFTGLVMIGRFIPETLGTLLVSGGGKRISKVLIRFRVFTIFALISLTASASLICQATIQACFGKVWLLNYFVVLIFCFSELLRGLYILKINSRIGDGLHDTLHFKSITLVLFTELVFATVSWILNEIVMIPIGLILGYLIGIIWISSQTNILVVNRESK